MNTFKECKRALETSSGIDAEAQQRFDELVEYWRSVLRRLFLIAQCMAEENMASEEPEAMKKLETLAVVNFLS